MRKYKDDLPKDIRKKNMKKTIRTIAQILFCITVVTFVTIYIKFPKMYKEDNKANWNQSNGFIALSYVGVARKDNNDLVSIERLDSHLKALHEAGYVSIGIDDIINFYEKGSPLPEKALYLTFEDGRKDSMIFAQKVLEKYNFKATMMSYAGNVVSKDRIFIKEKELKYLDENSFWEIGTNGYRFSYINVFDKNENIEDEDKDGKYKKEKFKYNHYLMDYIRDEDGIPLESKSEMRDRINWDYKRMKEIYEDALEYNPKAYAIMHANAIYENINEAVEDVNLENIYDQFDIMFNREGSCYNTSKTNKYNLTRMQVGSDWSVNKLLMEIKSWTDSKTPYVVGDEEAVSRWAIKGGVMNQDDNKLILTSPKGEKSFAYLKGSDTWKDIDLSLYLSGRDFGTQSVYLKYLDSNNYIKMMLKNNIIYIIEKTESSKEKVVFKSEMPNADKLPEIDDNFDLDRIDGNENYDESVTDKKYDSFDIKHQLSRTYKSNESSMESPVSWKISVQIKDSNMSIIVGNQILANDIVINDKLNYGGFAIECYSNNDEIYDGVYDELTISPINGE